MAMLADSVEVVIGVDTHKHTHTAAVVAAATGHTMVTMTVAATRGAANSSWNSPAASPVDGSGRSRAPAATAPA